MHARKHPIRRGWIRPVPGGKKKRQGYSPSHICTHAEQSHQHKKQSKDSSAAKKKLGALWHAEPAKFQRWNASKSHKTIRYLRIGTHIFTHCESQRSAAWALTQHSKKSRAVYGSSPYPRVGSGGLQHLTGRVGPGQVRPGQEVFKMSRVGSGSGLVTRPAGCDPTCPSPPKKTRNVTRPAGLRIICSSRGVRKGSVQNTNNVSTMGLSL